MKPYVKYALDKYPKIEICGNDGDAMYITIKGTVFYIDNSTGENIMDCWEEEDEVS